MNNINSKNNITFRSLIFIQSNFDPLSQFGITQIVKGSQGMFDLNTYGITSVYSTTILFVLLSLFVFAKNTNYTIWNYVFSNILGLIKNIIKGNTPLVRYQYYASLVILFIFIFLNNIIGLVPYSFTITSSFIVTFFFALTYFVGINLIGIQKYNWRIMSLFLPGGVPLMITTALILIETVSYIAKVFSLSIRLFANMMSGHALLKILTGFSWSMLQSKWFAVAILPWLIVTIIMHLELLIAFLQAYVFIILISIYISDVLVMH